MAGFPSPPPLKRKPLVSAIPDAVRSKIDHPERVTHLLIAFGTVGLLLFLLPALGVVALAWSWLNAHHVARGFVVFVLAVLAWMGFSYGMTAGRRLIIDALRSVKEL